MLVPQLQTQVTGDQRPTPASPFSCCQRAAGLVGCTGLFLGDDKDLFDPSINTQEHVNALRSNSVKKKF